MFLVRSVDCHALFTVSMVFTGFLTGTVILVLIFFAKLSGKFFLEPKSFFTVALVKFFHCSQFFWIFFNDHLYLLKTSFYEREYNNSILCLAYMPVLPDHDNIRKGVKARDRLPDFPEVCLLFFFGLIGNFSH